jgi:hypothetical protein
VNSKLHKANICSFENANNLLFDPACLCYLFHRPLPQQNPCLLSTLCPLLCLSSMNPYVLPSSISVSLLHSSVSLHPSAVPSLPSVPASVPLSFRLSLISSFVLLVPSPSHPTLTPPCFFSPYVAAYILVSSNRSQIQESDLAERRMEWLWRY